MKIGMVGLGKMGGHMVRRLKKGGHECVGFDLNPENLKAASKEGISVANSLEELVSKLEQPRVVWVMVPAGDATEATIMALSNHLSLGDCIVDGGNSYYKDDVRRYKVLKDKGIHYVDVGTSGGVWGESRGYCLMIGGDVSTVKGLDPIFKTLAPGPDQNLRQTNKQAPLTQAECGYLHCGHVGAGHFVKMIHNGIEYGMMEAFAEGFDILKNAQSKSLPRDLQYEFNLAEIAEVWRHGSVVSSWLLDLAARALIEDPKLSQFKGVVQDSGEGRWTIQAAIEEAVPAHVLSASLYTRFRSRQESSFADKLLSALRNQFGGHKEPSKI